jgi:hypothetical protein
MYLPSLSAAKPATLPIPSSSATASTGFSTNQLSSVLSICCQTVPQQFTLSSKIV